MSDVRSADAVAVNATGDAPDKPVHVPVADATPATRPRNDLSTVEARWADWVESTSRLLAIDPAVVDIPAIHDLTKTIAHELDRPLAPVASFMLGVAIGQRGGDADAEALKDAIAATAHGSHGAQDAEGLTD